MNDDLLLQRAQSRVKPLTALGKERDTEIAQRNFDEGLKRFLAQGGPSVLCEAVRPGERAMERRAEWKDNS